MGPLSMKRQLDRVMGYLDKGPARGSAKLVTGGGRPKDLNRGYFVEPTIFSNVTRDMTIAKEEIFGPVVSVMPYENEEDAIRIANNSSYGLSGAVFTKDAEKRLGAGKAHPHRQRHRQRIEPADQRAVRRLQGIRHRPRRRSRGARKATRKSRPSICRADNDTHARHGRTFRPSTSLPRRSYRRGCPRRPRA